MDIYETSSGAKESHIRFVPKKAFCRSELPVVHGAHVEHCAGCLQGFFPQGRTGCSKGQYSLAICQLHQLAVPTIDDRYSYVYVYAYMPNGYSSMAAYFPP
jgi:hypothetical protein